LRKKLFAILAVNLLLLLTAFSMVPAHGQSQGQWIVSYTVRDLQTGQILQQSSNTKNSPIVSGIELNITFTINVTVGAPSVSLKLSTAMQHATLQDRVWELQSLGYPGLSSSNYNPNAATIYFTQDVGSLTMSCYGSVQQGVTLTDIGNGIVLDRAINNFGLVILTGPDGTVLDQASTQIVDAKINEYQQLYSAANSKLSTLQGTADPAYVALYTSVLNDSSLLANQGFIDSAITALNSPSVTQAAPVSNTTSSLFLPSVIGLAVVIVLLAYLFVRARGKVSYVQMVVEDQIKDLEGLSLRASKIDRTVASGLEGVKDRLKNLFGE